MKRERESGERREEEERKEMVQRGRRRRLSTREDEGKPEDRERQRRGLSQRAAQPCRHGADNVMQGKKRKVLEES